MIEIGTTNDGRILGFDLESLVSTRCLIQAMSGGGKSWLLRRILEQSHGQIQQIIIDPEGEFKTLRAKFDYVVAGEDGDVQAHPKTARDLARMVMELQVSTICDLYELKSHQRIEFVKIFLDSLVNLPKSLWRPTLIVIDEAHVFSPEKGKAESAGAVIDLATRGRKRGYCAILATQRLSKLNKDACAELGNKLIGRTGLDIDQRRAGDELGMGRDESRDLRNLQPGQFHAFGPALRCGRDLVGGVVQVTVGAVITEHPTAGKRAIEAPPPPKGEKIRKALERLKDLPEQADKRQKTEADLRADNASLRREITLLRKSGIPQECNHKEEIGQLRATLEIKDGQLRAFRHQGANILGAVAHIRGDVAKLAAFLQDLEIEPVQDDPIKTPAVRKTPAIGRVNAIKRGTISSESPLPLDNEPATDEITRPQQKILNALAAYRSIGVDPVSRIQLGVLAGYKQGGAFNNYLGRLRTLGYIDYPGNGTVALTDAGSWLAEPMSIENLEELHSAWFAILTRPQAAILEQLIEVYPNQISRDDVAQRTGYAGGGGAFNNYCGRLRSLGAAEYPQSGYMKASELLFPEGLS